MTRRIELINQLINKHPKETGYSLPTLNRRIAQLVKTEKIGIIKKDKFPIFGIDDSHENASYLMSQGTFEKKQHFDEVISDIPKGSKEEVYTALYEILLYKSNYRLTPTQLNQIVSALRYDDKIIAIALQIIEETVVTYKVQPSNQEIFKKKLKTLLLKIRDNIENRTQIRQIVHILGFLMDDFVIDQLAHDAPLFDDNKITIEEYANGILIPIFEKNRSKLYELEKTFIKQGNEKAAKRIHSIRDHLLNPTKYGNDTEGLSTW